ncbi:MAG: hypothetical protein HOF66_05085 [Nitrosomonadaceae bacterium]|jgi:hypothetical protein|nr:hypothetical protein [Nitrosomonadaceae bacterium]
MSVFEARLKIETYLKNCDGEKMKDEAIKDFRMAIKDAIKLGYSWGGRHIIPIDTSKFSKRDLKELLGTVLE